MKEIKFKILHQGDVKLCHDSGYCVVGGDDAVCFYVDVSGRAYVEASTESAEGCPVLLLSGEDGTIIEFYTLPGWQFHSSSGGKTLSIALVRLAVIEKKKGGVDEYHI